MTPSFNPLPAQRMQLKGRGFEGSLKGISIGQNAKVNGCKIALETKSGIG